MLWSMGIFDAIFKPKKKPQRDVDGYFTTLTSYAPAYTDYKGGVFEMALTRAAVNAVATQCSKLQPIVTGSANRSIARALEYQTNPWQDRTKFLYRCCAILEAKTTCFIFPLRDQYGRITGYFPALPTSVRPYSVAGELWYELRFASGQTALEPSENVGVLTKFQMESDLFGDGNEPIAPTMKLIDAQNQAINNAIENSARIEWLVQITGQNRPEDIAKKRDQFAKDNLAGSNKTGVMAYDQTWSRVEPIDRKQYTVDAAQMEIIERNVYSYFGVNEEILQNKFNEDVWNAFYESKIEPFQQQLSLVLTNMTYTERERAQGNAIAFFSSSIDYMSNQTKAALCQAMADRGAMCADEFRAKFGLPPVPGGAGQQFAIRGEYILSENLAAQTKEAAQAAAEANKQSDEKEKGEDAS